MAAPNNSSPSNQAVQHANKSAEDVVPVSVSAPALKDPPPVDVSVNVDVNTDVDLDVKVAPSTEEAVATVASLKSENPPEVQGQQASVVSAILQMPPTYESSEASEAYIKAKQLLAAGAFEDALETTAESISLTMSVLSAENQELHESLAPLQYLYGTTLLYSVEETDSGDPMVQQQQGDGSSSEEQADDLQIAWENLESARSIVSTLVATAPTDKLKMDLAQIHLRLGDLQRTNGRYLDAISDYTSCLQWREPILGEYDRKVADAHYMLGLVCMMLASEGDKQQDQEAAAAAAAATGEPPAPTMSSALIEEYRTKSVLHYLSCSKSIAGIIATLCGVDANEMMTTCTADTELQESGGKTTGLAPEDLLFSSASRTLRTIRDRIAKFNSQEDSVQELAEMLDEIQETVDEAENTKKGLKDVSEMKASAQAAIVAADKAETEGSNPWAAFGSSATEKSEDGGTTTVGFGSASAAASTTINAAPMMMVKKKKKRDATQANDSKPAANNDSKKAKLAPTE